MMLVMLGYGIQIADFLRSGGVNPEEFAIGLQNEFRPLEGHDIGQFPGLDSVAEEDKVDAYQLTT